MNIGLIISLLSIIVVFIALFLLTLPFLVGGLRIMLGKFKLKQNAGLIFLRSKSGNFAFPLVCDTSKNEFVLKKDKEELTYPISRTQFEDNGTFFGMPYVMYDVEDAKNSLGLYYQASDKEGQPLYRTIRDISGEEYSEPVLSKVKSAITLPPSLIKALIGEQALTKALKDLFANHQILLYIVIGNIAVAGIGVYMLYELTSTSIPNIINTLTTILGIVGSL